MKKKISKYISLLALLMSSFIFCYGTAYAQEQKPKNDKETLKKEYAKTPFYQGSSVGVEVAGVIGHALGSDPISSEVLLQCNLKNRFMPALEIGYAKMDVTNDDSEMHYNTSAPYFRVGMDYNVFYLKPYLPGYLYVGLRYGFSSFSYDVNGPDMKDPNYGDITIPYSYTGIKSKAQWAELVIGIKVKIFKGFCMGWSVRYKKRVSAENGENTEPWYIPGYGENNTSNFNLNYNLIYNLPF
ncbi:DUF6048 family protein [uncultured Bacteroides sp.]|uniref:DUF6048 family protein n=1 Tax=uncultured Bacteroides sp. TaxID=162156 RepID=UPI00261170B3|nr:DUF6048 family protein [uncultured Bacteroides sp.]